VDAEPIEQVNDVGGETDGDSHIGEGVFEDEVPADDPRDEFTEGCVGIGVGAAGNGNHGSELGVAEAGESADERDENERERERGAGAGATEERGVVDEVVEDGRVEDGARIEFLPGDGGADNGENAGADDSADAERGERDRAQRFLQAVPRTLGVRD
jgi:hypothetical protein